MQTIFYFKETVWAEAAGIEPGEVSAEQVRGRARKDARGSERRWLVGAYRKYASGSGRFPPPP